MKDAESPDSMTFELHTVELGLKDHRGREVISAVLLESDKEFKGQAKRTYFTDNHQALLQVVRSRTAKQEPTTRAVVRDDLKAQGCNVNAFAKWVKKAGG